MHEKLVAMVFQALGEASACWEHIERAGKYQDSDVVRIGNELIKEIEELYGKSTATPAHAQQGDKTGNQETAINIVSEV